MDSLAREWRSELKCQKPESVRNQVCAVLVRWTWEAEHECWRPHGARPGWGSEATGRQARVKSAAGQGEPARSPSGAAARCSESPSAAPGQVGPAGLPSVVSGLCS